MLNHSWQFLVSYYQLKAEYFRACIKDEVKYNANWNSNILAHRDTEIQQAQAPSRCHPHQPRKPKNHARISVHYQPLHLIIFTTVTTQL
jgi:hypothetical protein